MYLPQRTWNTIFTQRFPVQRTKARYFISWTDIFKNVTFPLTIHYLHMTVYTIFLNGKVAERKDFASFIHFCRINYYIWEFEENGYNAYEI